MKFIINILPNDSLDESNLINFVNNIQSQSHKSELELILNRNQSSDMILNLIDQHQLPITLYKDEAALTLHSADNYWLNLHVDDALLPNAIMQWENVLAQHSTDLLLLTNLNNDLHIGEQLDQYFEKIGEVNLNTVQHIFDIDPATDLNELSLRTKLMLLLGLQTYNINDRNNRYRTFFNQLDLNGRNVLYRVTNDNFATDKGYLAKLMHDLIDNDAYLKLNLPTLILCQNQFDDEIKQTVELITNRELIFDEKVQNYYDRAIANRVLLIYAASYQENRATRLSLLAPINELVSELPVDVKRNIKKKLAKRGLLAPLRTLF